MRSLPLRHRPLLRAVLALGVTAVLSGAAGAGEGDAPASALVDCLDAERQVVVRTLPWQCDGRALTPEEAERRRAEIRERRAQRFRDAERGSDPPGAGPARSGTGFRVDAAGHVVTNRHVVEGCRRLRLRHDGGLLGEARLQARHPRLDIAVLSARPAGTFARFAESAEAADGGRLSAVGYPNEGRARVEATLVPLEPRTSSGDDGAPALWFLGDVRRGNSGSPVLDRWGRVVGMVSVEVDQVETYARTGQLAPEAGGAVPGGTLLGFLRGLGLGVATAPRGERLESAALLERARGYVVRVDCWS